MTMYSVDEVFEMLKTYKLASHKESVRRWLRQDIVKGIVPSSRKKGWQIPKEALDDFIQQSLPDAYTTGAAKEAQSNKTNVAKESDSNNTTFDVKEVEERILLIDCKRRISEKTKFPLHAKGWKDSFTPLKHLLNLMDYTCHFILLMLYPQSQDTSLSFSNYCDVAFSVD